MAVERLVTEAGHEDPTGEEAPEASVSLARATSIALANNPNVAAAAHAIDAARADRNIAVSRRLPRVGVAGGYVRHLEAQRLVPPSSLGESNLFAEEILSGDVTASVPLFTGGELTNELRAARLMETASTHRLSRARNELVFEVTYVFLDILAQELVVESLEFSRDAMREHLRRVEEMIAVRKAAPVDRLRMEVRLADLDERLARERGALTIRLHSLGSLLGLSRTQIEELRLHGELDHEGGSVDAGGAPNAEEALALAYQRREDYLAARATLEADARRLDAVRAGYMPRIALHGAYGGRWAIDASDGSERMPSADVGRLGVVLDLPVFEGGRTRAAVSRERARLASARERLRELELRIQLEVESAAVGIHSSAQRVRATAKASEQAEESLRIERRRYELARGSITDVLDAQAALLEAQTSHFRALADYRVALAELTLASGEDE